MREKAYTLFISFFVIFTLATVIIALLLIYSQFTKENDVYEPQNLQVGIILEESNDFGDEYINKIIFLGESTTYGLKYYGVLNGGVDTTQVWTGGKLENGVAKTTGTLSLSPSISSSKIFYPDTNEIMTIGDAISIKSPEYLIITLGLNNGVSYYSEEEFKRCYSSLLDTVINSDCSPKIILQSIFPVSKRCTITAFTPEKIKRCNEWIYELAEQYNIKYLNTYEALADTDGYLYENYENGDGIHLNKQGLEIVINYIKYHGYNGV